MPLISRMISQIPKFVWIIIGLLLLTLIGSYYYRISKSPPAVPNPLPIAITPQPQLNGIYKGDLPCADCPGITETLVLASDNSYILEDLYQEKSEKPFKTPGKWEINENILKLMPSDNSQPAYFQVLKDGNLQMLDSNMQKIDSPFNQTLTKQ